MIDAEMTGETTPDQRTDRREPRSTSSSADEPGQDPVAQRILDAAGARFLHYGYAKTTMSEIAGDCEMSTGNLYRFFPAKLDIAEAFVRRLRDEQMRSLLAAVADASLNPAKRLRAFLHEKLKLAYDRFHDRPKAYALSSELLGERRHIAREWEDAEAQIIASVLSDGIASGDLNAASPEREARTILDMTYRMTTPAVFHQGDFDELAAALDNVVDVILDAYRWRCDGAAKS